MTCDSYFGIGGGHLVCQDYALHGSIDGMEYVIVSDGCSSAEYSEIGAQLLCHAAKYHIASCYQAGLFAECSLESLSSMLGNSILKRVDEVRKIYPISQGALEATLLIAIKTGLTTYVFAWGDGVIIERYKQADGMEYQRLIEINYSGNAPFYLICDRKQYLQELQGRGFEDPKVFHNYYQTSFEGTKRPRWSAVAGEPFETEDSFPFYVPYVFKHVSENTRVEVLSSITICSDGITSFKDADKNPIELVTIVPEIIGYKATVGEFVKKRMFFLKRKAEQKDWSHYDDISCGTII